MLKKVHPLSFALKGVFNLGSVAIDELAIKWVKGETSGAKEAASSNNVVVYGSGMYAMSAMSKLLEAGVGAASIIWVHKGPIDLGNQEGIDEAIEESIVSTEVVEWNRFCLVDVLFDARSYVKGVKVLHADNSNGVPLVINCCAVLLADKFLCPVEVFSAINEAGIVFDGALVIDADFRTNDPHVYGVGDFTRYSRKFRNTQDLSKYRRSSRHSIHPKCNLTIFYDTDAAKSRWVS